MINVWNDCFNSRVLFAGGKREESKMFGKLVFRPGRATCSFLPLFPVLVFHIVVECVPPIGLCGLHPCVSCQYLCFCQALSVAITLSCGNVLMRFPYSVPADDAKSIDFPFFWSFQRFKITSHCSLTPNRICTLLQYINQLNRFSPN